MPHATPTHNIKLSPDASNIEHTWPHLIDFEHLGTGRSGYCILCPSSCETPWLYHAHAHAHRVHARIRGTNSAPFHHLNRRGGSTWTWKCTVKVQRVRHFVCVNHTRLHAHRLWVRCSRRAAAFLALEHSVCHEVSDEHSSAQLSRDEISPPSRKAMSATARTANIPTFFTSASGFCERHTKLGRSVLAMAN